MTLAKGKYKNHTFEVITSKSIYELMEILVKDMESGVVECTTSIEIEV